MKAHSGEARPLTHSSRRKFRRKALPRWLTGDFSSTVGRGRRGIPLIAPPFVGMRSVSEASEKRAAQVDLSGLSRRQIALRRRVVALGERAFGSRWQTEFATAASEEAHRHVGQAQVSHWISGRRPVPEGLIEPLRRLAFRLADELEFRAAEIRADWAQDPSEEDNEALAGL